MATSKLKKQGQLEALEALMKDAEGVAFVRFDGATVDKVQTIRRDLRAKGMTYTVIKKTLIALAAKNTKLAEFDSENLNGAVAVIISATDSVAPAAEIKRLKKESFSKAKKTSVFDFAGAVFEGKLLDEAETAILAETPSREESLSKIVSMLKSGPQKIHGILNSGLQKMHNVLDNADKIAA